ncbi:MAG: HAD family hydrolase [Candidatus Fermentibacteria bacterium]|nr:HAD family hydrolase [Candidatus Fermentibacteria bacterium]
MRYDTVIFDLDGTLVNTIPDIVSVVNSVLSGAGLEERSEDSIRDGVGFGIESLLRTLGVPSGLIPAIAQEVTRGYTQTGRSKAFIYPGVKKMLTDISSADIRLFVLSNKPEEALAKSVSDHLSFADIVDFRGSMPGKPAKPLPDTLELIIQEFDLKKESLLMVGDGEPDIQVSKGVGIDCLSVLWGFRSRVELEAAGGKLFAETPGDVTKYILQGEL